MAANTIPKPHVQMRFHFSGLAKAYTFRGQLEKLLLPAALDWDAVSRNWQVTTDTRCLQHATQLYRFLSSDGRKQTRPEVL